MRRRPTSNSSMSLFPFLDTLVCTMGALILMLLAMTPKIKERALARQAAAQAPAAGPEVEPDPEPVSEPAPPVMTAIPAAPPEDDRAAERQRRRDAWLAQAADARSALGKRAADFHLSRQQIKDAERQLRELQDRILTIQLKAENSGHAGADLDERAQQLEAQAAVVAQKIAATRKKIDLVNRRQAAVKNEYSLVAYDGTSGTLRRPIYIECTGKGFRFLPEDETISPSDLEGFSQSFNPLLAGAQTLVRFWSRRKRSEGPAEREPYVLLLVRPSGCFTYYVARQYLSALGVHWGYELIEEDWKLSVPDPDPVAKTMLKETLDATAQMRRPHKHDAAVAGRDSGGPFDPREFFDGDEARGRSTGAGGSDDSGFGGSGRGGAGGRKSSIKRGYATRNDRQAGDQFPGDDSFGSSDGGGGAGFGASPARGFGTGGGGVAGGFGTGSGTGDGFGPVATAGGSTGGTGASGGRTGTAQAAGFGGGSRSPRGAGTRGAAGFGDGSDLDDQSPTGFGMTANGPAGSGSGGSADSKGKQDGGTGIGSSIRDPYEGETGGDGGGNSGPGGGKRPGRPGSAGRARPASLGGSADATGDGDGSGGDESQPAGSSDDDELLMNPRAGSGGSGGPAGRQSGSPGSGTAGQPGAAGSAGAPSSATVGATSNNSAGGADGASGQSSPASWLSDPSGGSAGASGASPPIGKSGGPGVNVSLGGRKRRQAASQDDDDGPRIPEEQSGKAGGPAGRAQGPRKWGQVGRKAGIGFEKKIKIYLNDKRIVVDSKEHMLLVTPADSNDEIIGFVVGSIDHVADSWGEPPSNFYWVPVVQFVVYPGGNVNYARLQSALEQKWGVTSTVEYAADIKAKKASTGGRP